MRLSSRHPSRPDYLFCPIRSLWRFIVFCVAPACLMCTTSAPPVDQRPAVSPNIGCKRYESFVQLDTNQLTQRATHRQEPDSKLLNNAGVHATVVVRVFVNGKGRVVCDKIVGDANAFLGKLALEAARAWTFEPLLKDGHPTGMKGDLVFHIER
jgi:hypothetical protein